MEPASAAEGWLSEHKTCPHGLKPVPHLVASVRAEARTLQKLRSDAFARWFPGRMSEAVDTGFRFFFAAICERLG
jgi:hypothetical protein